MAGSEPTKKRVMLEATDEGSGLWKVVATPSSTAEALAIFEGDDTTQTIIFDATELDGTIVYVVDKAGNISEPLQLIDDNDAPTYEIIHEEGETKINVSDNKSGIYRIGHDIYDNYPAEILEYSVSHGMAGIEVEDALGNIDIVVLRVKKPEVTRAYKNGRNIIITAIDDGVGLLKVVSEEGETLATFTGEEKTQTIVFEIPVNMEIPKMYVVNKGGSYSEEINLANDTEESDQGPTINWLYRNSEEKCIYLSISDSVGLDMILDQDEHIRTRMIEHPLNKIVRYDIKEGDTVLLVKDVWGNETPVLVSDATLDVTRSYRNLNGDIGALKMKDDVNGIGKVVYLDDIEIVPVLEENEDTGHNYIVEEGTTVIRVYQEDLVTYADVQLRLDYEKPTIPENGQVGEGQIYKNEDSSKLVIKAIDKDSGIERIEIDETTLQIEGLPRSVVEGFDLQDAATIKIYDGVGNVQTLQIGEIENDTVVPSGRIVYDEAEDKYRVILQDMESGLWKLVRDNDNENLVRDFSDFTEEIGGQEVRVKYPQDERVVTLDTIIGLDTLEIYDAVGNKATIDLAGVRCIVTYAHKNRADDKMALSIFDSRGIKKLGIIDSNENEKIIEKFRTGNKLIQKVYEIPQGIVKLKVYYTDDDTTEISLGDESIYEVAPSITNGVVYAKVGIGKIVYDGQIKIRFTNITPVRVRINEDNYERVEVYDVLGNRKLI